jgi:hypothetical protein
MIMNTNLPDNLKIDRKTFSISSLTDDPGDKVYWLMQKPSDRLKYMELLRRINYGTGATARLQRILEVVEREEG